MHNSSYSTYTNQSIVGYYESVMNNIRLNKISAGVYNRVSNCHILDIFIFIYEMEIKLLIFLIVNCLQI